MAQAEPIDVVRDALARWVPSVRRAMRTRTFRYSALCVWPLVLVGLLCYARWRSEHPPLSNTDLKLRQTLSRAICISVVGDRGWENLADLKSEESFIVKDRATLRKIAETLRCTDDPKPTEGGGSTNRDIPLLRLIIIASNDTVEAQHQGGVFLEYQHWQSGSYIYFFSGNNQGPGVKVYSRFAKKFEALILDLARQAEADGRTQMSRVIIVN